MQTNERGSHGARRSGCGGAHHGVLDPQIARSIRSGSTHSFSWLYLTTFATGVSLWLA